MIPRVALAPGYTISRIVKGGWQLAGGHGAIDRRAAIADMHAFVDAGITTFDCADIYTGVEALIGDFIRERGRSSDLQIHTKYVPDRSRLAGLTAADVAGAVERSLARLGVEALDLVQFHWWDYAVPGAIDALGWLDDHRRAGRIRHLGVTNFDTPTLTALLDAGLPVVSHQVQYSVLDQRPATAMRDLCAARGVQLLCYGTVAGGLLGERYLDAAPPAEPLENRSLVKYRLIVDETGGWAALQRRLRALATVASGTAAASPRWPPPGCCSSRRSARPSSARGMPATWPRRPAPPRWRSIPPTTRRLPRPWPRRGRRTRRRLRAGARRRRTSCRGDAVRAQCAASG